MKKKAMFLPLDFLVRWIASLVDDIMIWFFTWRGNGDEPCGRLQSWARENRRIC
jgi:hypothetical protein